MPERTKHLDPRSPLVLDTKDLPRRPGAMKPAQFEVPAPDHLGLDMIGVPAGAPLALDLRLEWVAEGVLVSGTVTAPVAGECGRCLRPISDTARVTVQELYASPGSATEETTDPDEISRLDNDLVDLEPAVRDALVLELPTNPLCQPDCPGLCPECGVHLDDVPADHHHDQVDPRWAALGQLVDEQVVDDRLVDGRRPPDGS
jgi:uncharacterized protein